MLQRFIVRTFSIGLMIVGAGLACAQNYPSKSIRMVAPEAGGGGDFVARVVAQGLTVNLGQQVIVDNRGGTAGINAAQILTGAAPDGYVLLVIGSGLWLTPFMVDKVPYDPVRDFSPITIVASAPNILVVHPSVPVKSVKELIELAKAKPGELNYSSSAIGASPHLAAELFKIMTGVDIVHIPYKGAGSSLIGLISGQVQLSFATAASAAAQIKSGKVRALAATGLKPFALFPELPTVAATVPGYDTGGTTGMFAPAKTPAPIISRLNLEVLRLLSQADVKEKFLSVGVEVVGSTPEQLGASVRSEMKKWGKVIKDANIRLH